MGNVLSATSKTMASLPSATCTSDPSSIRGDTHSYFRVDEDSQSAQGEHLNCIRNVIRNFVSCIPQATMRYDSPPVDDLQAAVVEELNALGIPLATIQHELSCACNVVECFYPKHSLDLKVLIVICTLVNLYIDDILSINPEPLLTFQLNSLRGIPQEDPIIECLAQKLLPRMWDYFDPLAANSIAVGFLELINGTVMEGMAKSMMPLHRCARTFPEYVRLKSGVPAQYAFWLFPRDKHPDLKSYLQAIPDLLGFINQANDILSFYKEELAGDDDNYVHMRAGLSGNGTIATLEEICEETLTEISNITAILSHDPEAAEVFDCFIHGYLRFHFSTTRYKLEELMTTD